jgi:hypothetical protein
MNPRIRDLTQVFAKISNLVKIKSSLETIAPEILEQLGRSLGCEWGAYWHMPEQSLKLKPLVTWIEKGFSANRLDRDTKGRVLSLSEGTAGQVWKSRKPVWSLDLLRDMCLPRSLDADSSGLTGGIWFALKTEDHVFAVVELLGQNVTPPTRELLVGIESFGIHLGYLLQELSDDEASVVSANFLADRLGAKHGGS